MRLAALLLLPALCATLPAQGAAPTKPAYTYVKLVDTMVSMRDGVKLHTSIYVPQNYSGPQAIIFTRTPYSITNSAGRLTGGYRELAEDGYAFAFQDIRGHYGSEGTFVMMRPPRDRRDPKAIDEGSDAYDTIDWLIQRVPGTNGRVGMLGVSYDGWVVVQALMVQGLLTAHS